MNRIVDLAWLAGVFEGEGHISINKTQWGGTVGITQRSGQFIINVLKVIRQHKLPIPNINQPTLNMKSYTLVWSCMKGTQFLQEIRPFFRHPHKIARADIYLKFFRLEDTYKKRIKEGDKRERQLLFEQFELQQQIEEEEREKEPQPIRMGVMRYKDL